MKKIVSGSLFFTLLITSSNVLAAIDNKNILNNVISDYKAVASGWAGVIVDHATWLFWLLVLLSMVWTFGTMALRKADISEFFSEFVRFTVFTGFYYWLLANAASCGTAACPTANGIGPSIISGLSQIGAKAAGITDTASPSSIVDMGFSIWEKVKENSTIWSPVDSFVGFVLAGFIVVIMALIAINMLLVTITSWIMMYAGVFILGFGGARWTSEMAINYYKSVFGIALQLMTMILLVGVGKSFLDFYYTNMEKGVDFTEMLVMAIVALTLLVLVNKVPGAVAGMVSGAGVGNVGTLGAGAAMGAAAMAAAALGMGAAAAKAGAANIAGGSQALMAAFKGAQSKVASGSDVMSKLSASASSSKDGSPSPMSSAMGLNGSTNSGSRGSSSAKSSASQSAGSSSSGSQQSASAASQSSGGEASSIGDPASSADSSESADTNNSAGDEGSGGSSSGGSNSSATASGGSSSSLGTAGRIAADMVASLASGVGRMASNKAADMSDAAKARIAETAGGKLAAEINNPGVKAQERKDNQDIATADKMKADTSRKEAAAEARDYIRTGGASSSPEFAGDSIGGADQLSEEEKDEVSNFAASKQA